MGRHQLVPFIGNEHPEQKMTSREIAELVEKRHDNVRRTIETLADRGVIEFPQIEEIPTATKPMTVYVFTGEQGKRDSIIVMAQLCPEFTARLVDRWAELEARQHIDPMAALNDPATMRHLLLGYTEKVIALESRVDELAPKADALDRIATADGSLCFRDAAKVLQVRPKDLTDFLVAHGWIYTRMGVPGYIAYQPKLQAGLLEHKTTTVHRSDGSEKVVSQCRVTPKGLARLAKEFPPIVTEAA